MTFLKKLPMLTVLILLGLLSAPVQASAAKPASTDAPKANTAHLKKIKMRVLRSFQTAKPHDTETESLLKELRPDGSFASVNYASTEFNTGKDKQQHLTLLTKLARAYAVTPGTYFRSREVYDAIALASKYWVEKNYQDQNWWWRIIGFPKSMMIPVMLVGEDMRRYDKELYAQCIDYLLYSWSVPEQRAQEGANGTDICKFTFVGALSSENAEVLQQVMEKVNSLIKIAQEPKEEGIQPDFSFAQHNASGRQMYIATYGKEYVDGIIYFMDFVNGTDFDLAPEKIDIFERLLVDGLAWTWYGGDIDAGQYGRGLLRPSTAPAYLALTERIIALNTPRNADLKKAYAMMKGSAELNGNRFFPRGDYMVHRPQGAWVSTRMTSTRTVGNEAGSGEGNENYHTGDGANYIKVHGDEYNPIFHGWNWRFIPGTTVMADTAPMPTPDWGKRGGGGSDFAGGASDGVNGVSAFVYAKDSLKAHKAWFYFDRYFVALGAGIATARTDAPVMTTVNQTMLSGKVALAKGGTAQDMSGGTSAPGSFDRLWHYDVGYHFEPGTEASAAAVKANYKADYNGKKADVLGIAVEHGTAPSAASYAYAVYPAMGRDEFMSRGEDYRILINTAKVQAVQDIATGKTMVVFYEPGVFQAEGLGEISADQPSLLLIEKADGKVKVTAGSPYCEATPYRSVGVKVGSEQFDAVL